MTITMRAIAPTFLLSLLAAACGSPRGGECSITCGPGAACPSDSVCGSDGYCHAGDMADPSVLCDVSRRDGSAGIADADPHAPDADPHAPDADPYAPDADPGRPDAGTGPTPPDAGSPSGLDAGGPGECDVYDQTGCPAGLACDVGGAGYYCRPIESSGTSGDPCEEREQCAAGWTCTAVGQCRRYCEADGACTDGPGDVCEVTAGTGHDLCSVDCTPITNAGCMPGFGCYLRPVGKIATDCLPAGSGGSGAACTNHEDCTPGSGCYDFGDGLGCTRLCRVDAGGCPFGTECAGISPPAYLGDVEYGICV
jgi:hypothetical protein